jgi:hypothetical protein
MSVRLLLLMLILALPSRPQCMRGRFQFHTQPRQRLQQQLNLFRRLQLVACQSRLLSRAILLHSLEFQNLVYLMRH